MIIFKLIDMLGFWRYFTSLDQTQIHQKLLNRIYWLYKWYKPIINPEKSSGLEAYFTEKRRQIDQSLLHESFHYERSVAISAVGYLFTADGIETILNYFDQILAKRKKISRLYRERLADVPGIIFCKEPPAEIEHNNAYVPVQINEDGAHRVEQLLFFRMFLYSINPTSGSDF